MATGDSSPLAIAVTTATEADRDRVLSSLVLAFVRDPVVRWAYPAALDYLTFAPQAFAALGVDAYANGTAQYAGAHAGAAFWIPPGVTTDDEPFDAVSRRSLTPERYEALNRLFAEMERYHPTEPHWYLTILGVDPGRHGTGHGSALLAHMLRRVDAEHAVAALESSNPTNVPLYERFGFEITGKIRIGEIPLVHTMARPARS
jgi:ribosomal protein S18 acetylase RimI-like enzyme